MPSSRILTLALDEALSPIGLSGERARAIESDEAALLEELQARSEQAFAYLVAVYENPVFNLVLHILGNQADAADVLQDVFIKVFRAIRQFHGSSSLKTWIYRITLHEASNHRRGWRRRHVHEPISLDEGPGQPGMVVALAARARSESPYEALEQAERERMVRQAIASVPEPYRTVLVLREIEDMTYEEIAEIVSVADGTVKSRLKRGRELLRRKLLASSE